MGFSVERLLFRYPASAASRLRGLLYRCMGMRLGGRNRFESGSVRRFGQICLGSLNTFNQGYRLWCEDKDFSGVRIHIGSHNFFNHGLMLDAWQQIEIGSHNMFGPNVYVTDADHRFGPGVSPSAPGMQLGTVKIGNHCWIGANAVILKNVELGDYSVVGAGAVVTKSFPAGSVIGGVPAKRLNGDEAA